MRLAVGMLWVPVLAGPGAASAPRAPAVASRPALPERGAQEPGAGGGALGTALAEVAATDGAPAELAEVLRRRAACRPADVLALIADPRLPADAAAGRARARPLTARERAVAAALLDALDPEAVRAAVLGAVGPDAPAALRAAALRALVGRGRGRDLPWLLAVASGIPEVHRARGAEAPTPESSRAGDRVAVDGGAVPPLVAAATREAAAWVLAADGASSGGTAFHTLGACFDGLPPGLHVPLLQAAGRVPTAASARFLAERLWRDRRLNGLVLSQIGRVADELEPPVDEGVRRPVRAFLVFGEPSQRRLAATTLGRLRDEDAVGDLVELLSAEDPGLRRNAHWALRHITGLGLRADPERWELWLADERRWWHERAELVLAELRADASTRVTAAINEVVQRRLHRHALAERLVEVLEHPDEAVVVLACRSLGQLGSPVAAPALRACVELDDARIRAAAAAALRALAGSPFRGPDEEPGSEPPPASSTAPTEPRRQPR